MTPSNCNACGGPLTRRLTAVRDNLTRKTFDILSCERCGLGHTAPVPADLRTYYGPAYHGGRHGVTAGWAAWRRTRMIHRATSPSVPRALLDIGCGEGSFLLAARRRGWSATGVEKYPALARASGLDVYESVEQAAIRRPFGCITLWHSLEHMTNPRAVVERVRDLLAPGGSLVIAVPDWSGLQASVFKREWIHLDVPRHLFHFTAPSLRGLLERCGFSVTQTWHQELEYDLMGWAWSGLNFIGPAWSNAFFAAMTGKRSGAHAVLVAGSLGLGAMMLGLSVPAVAAGTLIGRGGTIVMAATARAPDRFDRSVADG